MLNRIKNASIPIIVPLLSITLLAGIISCTAPTKSVAAALEAFTEAFRTADIEALDQMLTDDYVHTNTGASPIGKAAWLDWMASRREQLARGDYVMETYELEEPEIALYGTAAVVTGMVHASGTSNNQPFDNRIRVTNLWVYEHGRWRRAAFHDTPAS